MNRKLDQIKTHIELNNLRLGHNPLVDEPLTEDDWDEVWRAYVSFQHHLRMIVLKARKRSEKNGE